MEDPMLTDEERATLRAARDIIDRLLEEPTTTRRDYTTRAPAMPRPAYIPVTNLELGRRAARVMDCHHAWVDLESGELAILVSQETEADEKGWEGFVAYRYTGAGDTRGVFNSTLAEFVERFEPKE